MTDAKILYAILALHERFIEEPTEQKIYHLDEFIGGGRLIDTGCMLDVSMATWTKLQRYMEALDKILTAKFSPKSIAHLTKVAKETLE